MPEFSCYFKNHTLHWVDALKVHRAGRASGGCLFGFKKCLQEKYRLKFQQLSGATVLSLLINNDKIFLIPCYLNCNNWVEDLKKLENTLVALKDYKFCIFGDLNARLADAQVIDKHFLEHAPLISAQRCSKDTVINSEGRKLLSVIDDFGGIIINGRISTDTEGSFTFFGPTSNTVIDYGICSLGFLNYVKSFEVQCKAYSDHMPLVSELIFSFSGETAKKNSMLPKRLVWQDKKQDSYNTQLLSVINCEYINHVSDINQKVEVLKEKIKVSAGLNSNSKSLAPKNKWYDWQCENARRRMLKALNKLRKFNTPEFREDYKSSRSFYLKICREKKALKYENDIAALESVKNSKDWWALANGLKQSKPKINTNLSSNDFRVHFEALLKQDSCVNNISWSLPMVSDPFLDAPFELRELRLVLNSLKDKKAPGKDRIPYEFYKYAPLEFQEEVLALLNQIFLRSDFPRSFRTSIIVPLFKKGDPNLPSNYRCLCFADTLNKIFSGILLIRINSWIDCNESVLNEFQFGFERDIQLLMPYSV